MIILCVCVCVCVCVCSSSQTEQPGFVQQLQQQQHGEPASLPAAQPHCGAASGSDQTAHDFRNHHQTHRVGLTRARAHPHPHPHAHTQVSPHFQVYICEYVSSSSPEFTYVLKVNTGQHVPWLQSGKYASCISRLKDKTSGWSQLAPNTVFEPQFSSPLDVFSPPGPSPCIEIM